MKFIKYFALFLVLLGCSSDYEWGWYILSPDNVEGLTNLKFLISGISTTIFISVISIIYLGIIATGLAWVLRFKVLKENGLVFQSTVAYLIPIFGVILGYLILDELITFKVLIALIATVVGIYFVKKSTSSRKILN